jgi:hypothetical protein
VSCLTYEYFKSGDILFEYGKYSDYYLYSLGSYGDKFYIILAGSVKVLIPNP